MVSALARAKSALLEVGRRYGKLDHKDAVVEKNLAAATPEDAEEEVGEILQSRLRSARARLSELQQASSLLATKTCRSAVEDMNVA